MSCATHFCTARMVSSRVLGAAAASICCTLSLEMEPNEDRSRAFRAYQLPTSCHVSGEESATCITTSFESAA